MIKEILYIKSILDLLNDYYPPNIEDNIFLNQKIILQQKFCAFKKDSVWQIKCNNYWVIMDKDFKELSKNLIIISNEENIKLEFSYMYTTTCLITKKKCLENNEPFLGRVDFKPYEE